MAWILEALWFGMRSMLRPSSLPTTDSVVQAPDVPSPHYPPKHFYSLMIEVHIKEATAETLQLFSEADVSNLSATLNLPVGSELRRCLYISPKAAEVLIEM